MCSLIKFLNKESLKVIARIQPNQPAMLDTIFLSLSLNPYGDGDCCARSLSIIIITTVNRSVNYSS